MVLERNLSPSTINVRLSAIRNLLREAKRAGVLGAEEASQIKGDEALTLLVRHGRRVGLFVRLETHWWRNVLLRSAMPLRLVGSTCHQTKPRRGAKVGCV